jgi:hypothetical protein
MRTNMRKINKLAIATIIASNAVIWGCVTSEVVDLVNTANVQSHVMFNASAQLDTSSIDDLRDHAQCFEYMRIDNDEFYTRECEDSLVADVLITNVSVKVS